MAVQRLLLLATPPLSAVGERVAHAGLELATEDTSVKTLAHGWSLGASEAKVSDILQGGLGNSYFLAGLAALANTHPEIIEDAFFTDLKTTVTEGGNFCSVRFFFGGVEQLVAVEDSVPSNGDRLFFAKMSNDHKAWPVLMEKAWAKLSGSYVATSIGLEEEAFEALTEAPVHTHRAVLQSGGEHEWHEPRELWKALMLAKENSFPMSAASTTNEFGLAAGHTFAIIDVAQSKSVDLPRRVKVYNPPVARGWSAFSQTSEEGDHWLTFQDFQKVFHRMAVAHVRPDYTASTTRIPVGKPTAWRFTISEEGPFAVQVQWPTDRFMRVHGCFSEPNHTKLFVGEESGQSGFGEGNSLETVGSLRVDMEGSGTYLVYAAVTYPGVAVVSEAIVKVYAREKVRFEEITDRPALEVGRQILGKEQFEEKSEEEVPSGCGLRRGDHVELQAKGSEDRECGVVIYIIGGQQIGVLFRVLSRDDDGAEFFLEHYKDLPCDSSRLHRVGQCSWQPSDKLHGVGYRWQPSDELTRCDKLMSDQISRLEDLDNEDPVENGADDEDFPRMYLTGPAFANCGDLAAGVQGYKPCWRFQEHYTIRDMSLIR